MSRFPPIRCYECGNPLDDIYETYRAMRSILRASSANEVHVEKEILNTSNTERGEDVIFRALGLRPEQECCKLHLMTTVIPKDLESVGSQLEVFTPDSSS
jgi:DNA-directed RNA polymerase subunit N (RpoN/RPB10)